jgi:hypothetical protein
MTYYICHGAGAVHYIEVPEGTSFASGQPTIEEFTDEAVAIARAEELGYVFPEEEET